MQLTQVLDACQGAQLDNWRQLPISSFNEPGIDLLAGSLWNAGGEDKPALVQLTHLHRAVYVPDVRLGLGWGMATAYTEQHRGQRPQWARSQWNPIQPMLAHVLFNGTVVWRTYYTYVNRGAGRDGLLPWPKENFEEGPDYPLDVLPGGWDTTLWEVEFVRLLIGLQEIDDWDYDEQLRGWGLRVLEASPLDLTRPGGPRDD
jgi:hypothetical protein